MPREASRRQLKVAGEIKKALSEIFLRGGSSYYGRAFVTLTEVEVTPDMLQARVFVSVMNAGDRQEVVDRMNGHASEIRRRLGAEMRHQVRHIPELHFRLDDTLDRVFQVENLLKDL